MNENDNDGQYQIILLVTECEQLAQSGYVKRVSAGSRPSTYRPPVGSPDHYTTTPHTLWHSDKIAR